MRFSYRWLCDYVQLNKGIPEILEGFTISGLEVETALDMGAISGKVLIGQIKKIEPHPNADNLSICIVDVKRERPLNIVCGAKNMKEGDKVAVAVEGAHLASGITIKNTRIRGEVSEGMLCAGDELGLNDDHSGILILPGNFPVGEPLDAIIDISVTPNRGDCLSVIGLARDLAAYFGSRIKLPAIRIKQTMDRIENYLKVSVKNRQGCPRYVARYMRGVRVGKSPPWMTYRLESAGLRPINNIVDATNYVMLEYGQPIHAFDLDRVANRHIIVRNAREGEILETLDGESLPLTPDDLLITDPAKPIALAGVMGGINSGITASTINVVLECAYFDPVTIRKTSRRLGKQTDASFRFERTTDIEAIPRVLDRVAQLIQETAGGEIVQGIIDIKGYRPKVKTVSLPIPKTNKVLGVKLGAREIADLLLRLNFEITASSPEILTLAVPSYRSDITRDVDLIEEVARMYGYGNIKPTLPYLPARPIAQSPLSQTIRRVKETLSPLGFDEAITYSFTSSRLARALGLPLEGAAKLTNPISPDQDIMRTSLLPGFIETIAHNLNRDIFDLKIYEIGKVFRRGTDVISEEVWLIAGMCGNKSASWKQKGVPVDFYDIKGAATVLMDVLGFSDAALEPQKNIGYFHPGRAAHFIKGTREVCRFGEIHPILAERLELKRRLYFLEINLSATAPIVKRVARFRPIPKFPAVVRDIAIVIDETVPAQEVEAVIKKAAGADVESMSLFDIYTGAPVPQGKKSLAYSLTFRGADRTLTDSEVAAYMDAILSALKKAFNATLR